MRTRLVALALLVGTNVAVAETPRRKTGDKLSKAAGAAFARALAFEDKGKLDAALSEYRLSIELAPHADTFYNIAAIHARKKGEVAEAITNYEVYLAMSPRAPDRAAVEATIKSLLARPTQLEIAFATDSRCIADPTAAYVLVDGAIVRRPGAKPALKPGSQSVGFVIPSKPGRAVIDVVSDISHDGEVKHADPGENQFAFLCVPPRVDGNVVVQSGKEIEARFAGTNFDHSGDRKPVPPGKQRFQVRDRGYECPPITVNVPTGDNVAYVYIAATEVQTIRKTPARCRKLEVKQLTLAF